MTSNEILYLLVGVATVLLGAITHSPFTIAIGAGVVICSYALSEL